MIKFLKEIKIFPTKGKLKLTLSVKTHSNGDAIWNSTLKTAPRWLKIIGAADSLKRVFYYPLNANRDNYEAIRTELGRHNIEHRNLDDHDIVLVPETEVETNDKVDEIKIHPTNNVLKVYNHLPNGYLTEMIKGVSFEVIFSKIDTTKVIIRAKDDYRDKFIIEYLKDKHIPFTTSEHDDYTFGWYINTKDIKIIDDLP